MGRTVNPFSWQVTRIIDRFKEFRKALKRDEQLLYDELMRSAQTQISCGVMASNPNPYDSMSMAMHIKLLKDIKSLNEEVEKVKAKLRDLSEKQEN